MLTLIARFIGRSVVTCLVLAILAAAAPPASRPQLNTVLPPVRVHEATWAARRAQNYARVFVRSVDGLIGQVWNSFLVRLD